VSGSVMRHVSCVGTQLTSELKGVLRRRPTDSERGSVSVWVAITTPALLLMLLLVVDGGAKMKAGEQADANAAEAARAATIGIGPRPAGGTADARAAVAAADAYLSRAGVRGTATVTGPVTVTVRVTVTRTGPISGARFTVTRTATAQLLIGVETGHTP
jgi:Flp pilus assembly protein TadG